MRQSQIRFLGGCNVPKGKPKVHRLTSGGYSNIIVTLNFGKEVIDRFCNVICNPPPLDILIQKCYQSMYSPKSTRAWPVLSSSDTLYFCCLILNWLWPCRRIKQTRLLLNAIRTNSINQPSSTTRPSNSIKKRDDDWGVPLKPCAVTTHKLVPPRSKAKNTLPEKKSVNHSTADNFFFST